jgi:cbb3-type cytochrome oxidase maturation protein
MSGLVVLVPIALLMGLGALAAFLWALRAGQYDDLEGASQRILGDDADRRP